MNQGEKSARDLLDVRKAMLEELGFIASGKASPPKSLAELKANLAKARKVFRDLNAFGPNFNEELATEAGRVFLKPKNEFRTVEDEKAVEDFYGNISSQFQRVWKLETRARARLELYKLFRKGLTPNQIAYGLKNPGKQMPKTLKALRYKKGNVVIRLTKGKK